MGHVRTVLSRRCWKAFALASAIVFGGRLLAEEVTVPRDESFPWQLSYVYPVWQQAEDYKRISEYFTGKEPVGNDVILRTDRAIREGLYFRIGLPSGKNAPEHARVRVEYLRSDEPRVRTEEFILPTTASGGPFSEVRLGLTGAAWPKGKLRLVAWRVTLRDEAGRPLAQAQSYLWGFPSAERNLPKGTKNEKAAQ